jgi:hypothetical protein
MSYVYNDTPDGWLAHDEITDNFAHLAYESAEVLKLTERQVLDRLTEVLDALSAFGAYDSEVHL